MNSVKVSFLLMLHLLEKSLLGELINSRTITSVIKFNFHLYQTSPYIIVYYEISLSCYFWYLFVNLLTSASVFIIELPYVKISSLSINILVDISNIHLSVYGFRENDYPLVSELDLCLPHFSLIIHQSTIGSVPSKFFVSSKYFEARSS